FLRLAPAIAHGIENNVSGLYVLVDQTALMELADGASDRWSESQKLSQLKSLTKRRFQITGTAKIKQEQSAAASLHEFQRPHVPVAIQIILECKFMSKSIDGSGRGGFRSRQHGHQLV